ncbi:15950_t:CDS:2, partial [Gigaspora margarita]
KESQSLQIKGYTLALQALKDKKKEQIAIFKGYCYQTVDAQIDFKWHVNLLKKRHIFDSLTVHGFVVVQLLKYFEVPNGGVIVNLLIDVACSLAHYQPHKEEKLFAPDIAIYPGLTIILKPSISALLLQCRLSFYSPRPSRHLEILTVDNLVGS